jgi:hypothetical protein
MTSPIRVRRHTDGRVAYLAEPDDSNPWLVYMPWPILTPHGNTLWAEERDVSGDGWSELLVAELPEPDHHADGEDEHGNATLASQWEVNCFRAVDGILTAWTNGLEIEGVFYDGDETALDEMEKDCLKLLAAITEHRRCAALVEQETTP